MVPHPVERDVRRFGGNTREGPSSSDLAGPSPAFSEILLRRLPALAGKWSSLLASELPQVVDPSVNADADDLSLPLPNLQRPELYSLPNLRIFPNVRKEREARLF